MELMVTLTLAAVLLSFGAGAFLSLGKRTAFNQSMADAAALVNKVRNASSRFPAALVVDPEYPTGNPASPVTSVIYGRTEQVLQELHFEARPGEGDETTFAHGIGGLTVDTTAGQLVERGGRVGGGLRLTGSAIDCGTYAAYDVLDGVAIELWINPDRLGTTPIIEKGGAFSVRLVPARSGPGRLQVTIGVDEQGLREEVGLTAAIPQMGVGEWVGVFIEYDRTELRVLTDHGFGPVERAKVAETRQLKPAPDSPLRVGTGFMGIIDDFRFGGVTVEDPIRLSSGVTIDGDARTIHFRNGKLDSRFHPGVEQIRLTDGSQIIAIEVGPSGTVQRVRTVGEGEEPPVQPDGSTGIEKE